MVLLLLTLLPTLSSALTKKKVISARSLVRISNPNHERAIFFAREKARAKAEVSLLRKLKLLNVTTDATVEDILEKRDGRTIRKTRIKGSLRGAQIIQEGRPSPSLYEVIVGIPISQLRADFPPSSASIPTPRKYIKTDTKNWPRMKRRRRKF